MQTRILIADDHSMMREGLRSLLATQDDVAVIAEAGNGRDALKLAGELKPDVVIMDIGMPDLNGVEATRQLMNMQRAPKVISLSMHSDRRLVGEMLRAGAAAFVLKECAFQDLAVAIRAVLTDQRYLSPRIVGVVLDDYVDQGADMNAVSPSRLTHRQREILQLLAEGLSSKDVACRLNLSLKTIETHRRRIMDRLGLYTIAELTKYAIREGLTALES